MTEIFIDLHHIGCKQNGKSTKILRLDIESGDAVLECGCKVIIVFDKFTAVI